MEAGSGTIRDKERVTALEMDGLGRLCRILGRDCYVINGTRRSRRNNPRKHGKIATYSYEHMKRMSGTILPKQGLEWNHRRKWELSWKSWGEGVRIGMVIHFVPPLKSLSTLFTKPSMLIIEINCN